MANYYFGINRGGNGYSGCAVGTSTTSKDIELFVNGTNVTDKETVFLALEILQEYLVQNNWTPV